MRATQFKERRLPKVGDAIHDDISGAEVIVERVDASRLWVSGPPVTGWYARAPRFFSWKERAA